METYFASAYRADEKRLQNELETLSNSPLVTGLLYSANGLLAIINEHRQIISVNDSLLRMMGINDAAETLGLRPGDALNCVHADEEPDGCGTTRFCSTCGAAIAIVSSLGQDKPSERICALTAKNSNGEKDLALLVRSQPVLIENKRFLLLFLQDITEQQQRAALERTFFHDINNTLGILQISSELLVSENSSRMTNIVHDTILRLNREISIQKFLMQEHSDGYQLKKQRISPKKILEEIKFFFTTHPSSSNIKILFIEDCPDSHIYTDTSLLFRVLTNMIINALEATEKNGFIKFWIEQHPNHLSFNVWNNKEIAQNVAKRIFQRNFSTKNQPGRGIGTFSMKLFGEKFLGGKVDFTTSVDDGTVFKFSHPV